MQQFVDPYVNSYIVEYTDGSGDVSLERNAFKMAPGGKLNIHTVLEGETIQNIAFGWYGDSGYWGIIADANNIYNPFDDLVPGLELVIPINGGY